MPREGSKKEETEMAQKDIIFIIVAEQAYIHSADSSRDFSYGNEQLFTAISGTYAGGGARSL